MDCQDYITESVERKKGQHLQREERGAIQHLKNAGYTNRAIARAIGCSPTTVGNELKTRRTESVLGNHTESVTALASFAG